ILLTTRLLAILPSSRAKPAPRIRGSPTHILIVLGSGGHTAEMLTILRDLDPSTYTNRTYVVGSGDAFSASHARKFEAQLEQRHAKTGGTCTWRYAIVTVPRARRVHQSLLTTPVSALQCLWCCLQLLRNAEAGYPDLILTNGPGTGVIVVLASLVLRLCNVGGASSQDKMRTLYIESWARVKSLSLSGRLLLRVVDR
ncbi:oligosaccharide biosynthesis protein Alg14 like protein, partial [Pseudovirgaria hyperparasitica]